MVKAEEATFRGAPYGYPEGAPYPALNIRTDLQCVHNVFTDTRKYAYLKHFWTKENYLKEAIKGAPLDLLALVWTGVLVKRAEMGP